MTDLENLWMYGRTNEHGHLFSWARGTEQALRAKKNNIPRQHIDEFIDVCILLRHLRKNRSLTWVMYLIVRRLQSSYILVSISICQNKHKIVVVGDSRVSVLRTLFWKFQPPTDNQSVTTDITLEVPLVAMEENDFL